MRKTVLGLTTVVALAAPAIAAAPAGAIIGGRAAVPTDNPSMVGLSEHGEKASDVLFCGGALVAPTVVVTAMHCLEYFKGVSGNLAPRIDVIGGALSRTDPALQRVQVAEVVRNPQYDTVRTLHDVLVLRLKAPLNLPTLALAGPGDEALEAPGSILTATGWGLTNFRDDDSQPQALKEADIPVVSDSVCQDDFGRSIFQPAFQFCGQAPGGRPDTCQGDSGGPLVGGPADARKLVGVVSYGPASCGEPGGSAVYASVAAERAFILGAAGVPDLTPVTPAPTPAPAPAAKRTVRLRVGTISCGATTCSITIRASGSGRASIRDLVLRADRKAQSGFAPAKRFVRAKKVAPGVFRARTLLPYGVVKLTATAYDASAVQLGASVRETIEVS